MSWGRSQAQDARIDELQRQLDQMKSMINLLHRPPSTTSSDAEPDDGGGYSDDDDSDDSYLSRPASPAPPSRPNLHQPSRRSVQDTPSGSSSPHTQSVGPHPPSLAPKAPSTSRLPPARPDKHARGVEPAAPERFAKADLARLTTALEPTTVQRWMADLIETLIDYSPDAAWLLALPAPTARLAIARYAHLRPLDRWAARQALNTMQIDN